MIKILFVSLPSTVEVYKKTNVKVVVPNYPNLSLATIAGNLPDHVKAELIDLDFYEDFLIHLKEKIDEFHPDFIAMEIKTVTFNASEIVSHFIRKYYPEIKIIAGGVHITTFAYELCQTELYDYLVMGEGDFALNHIIDEEEKDNIIKITDPIDFNLKKSIEFKAIKIKDRYVNMDKLALPRWDLFNIKKYVNSYLSSKDLPVGLMETSRGCAFECNFCNKNTFGKYYRGKSVERVVEEFQYLERIGFREVHIMDDSFTQDLNRAKNICETLIKKEYGIPWSLFAGVRVDLVDQEFFYLAKKAGVWQVSFGIESGNQKVLDRIKKRTTLSQIENAVKMAVRAGLDTFGFFIIGLSGDTRETIMDTIRFATKLPLSLAKFDICIPYPGTGYYKELEAENRIFTKDWSKYICHQIDVPIYDHENLSWEELRYFYKLAYRKYFLRPHYIIRRLHRDLKMGDLFDDTKYFIKSIFSRSW